MRHRDTFDVGCSLLAVVADALAVFAGFLLAFWIRFDSGWLAVTKGLPDRGLYDLAALAATGLFLVVFKALGLYVRPQTETFSYRIPKIMRATLIGMLLALAYLFAVRMDPPFSRLTAALALPCVAVLLLLARALLFRIEIAWARRQASVRRVLIVGADAVAARLRRALENDPRLRSRVVGFILARDAAPEAGLPAELLLGNVVDSEAILDREKPDQLILADPSLGSERIVELMLACERRLVTFKMVPDFFRLLTSRLDLQTVDGVPVLGFSQWPLDYFWNRFWKRLEDIVGALVGLLVSAPILAVAAVLIKRESPGPVFYRQERSGALGRRFVMYKLRTMRPDAEAQTGPVWTRPDDPRRTAIGAFLRAYNLDELPQYWNVLKGDMSLVGPRPERPHFVAQFRDDIQRYMLRHRYKPGMTGWAQVNGLRGQTGLEERIQYDLFYLENWSLALDFKILARTFFTRKNAY